ncbi:MAG: DUF1460 domain-containing protein [Ignavibacteria bacterium]|nr:DUF1460 domain-containing protein [Ignavibacteria bacterium]
MITRRNFIKASGLTSLYLTILSSPFKSVFALDDYDEVLCRKKFKIFIDSGLKDLPAGMAMVEIGKSFIGTDYEGGTLDKEMKERLVVNLTGLDCVTFVENCLVFTRCLKNGKTTFDDYKTELQKVRYRNGVIDGYSSRLHYFCDWIYDNENKGILKDITRELGGVVYDKEINFMSSNPKYYKQLSDKSELEKIKVVEESINSRTHYYIPRKNISGIYEKLKSGDIIATTTSISGLDVTHTGLIVKEDSKVYFLHASSKSKKVVISSNELEDYVAEDSKKTGIIVSRPEEP